MYNLSIIYKKKSVVYYRHFFWVPISIALSTEIILLNNKLNSLSNDVIKNEKQTQRERAREYIIIVHIILWYYLLILYFNHTFIICAISNIYTYINLHTYVILYYYALSLWRTV